jgi:hypothetical protein
MPPDPYHARLPPCGFDCSTWHIPVQIPKKKFFEKIPLLYPGEPFDIKCLPTPVCMVFPHAGSTAPHGIFRFRSQKKIFEKIPLLYPGGPFDKKCLPTPVMHGIPPCGFDCSTWHIPVQIPKKNF